MEMEQQQFYGSIASVYECIFPVNNQQVELLNSEFRAGEEFFFLDVGCSTGQLANYLCQSGALGLGIDQNREMIRRANENYRSSALSFKEMDMLSLSSSFPGTYFDAIICFGNTLVHLDSITQIRDFLSQCAYLLKTNGILFLQIINYCHILSHKVRELPLIENDKVRFERFYVLPSPNQPRITFKTRLTNKAEGTTVENKTNLIPIQKSELERILKLVGFSEINIYSGFDKRTYVEDQLPLVVIAHK